MIPRRPLAALAALPLVALAGCSDGPFAPIGPLAGEHYLLSHVNGEPLPALVWGAPDGARLEIVAERLAFRPFARVERERVLRYTDEEGAVETTTHRIVAYYRVRTEPTEVSSPGTVLRIGGLHPCPAPSPTSLSVACDPEEQAIVHDGELRLATIMYGAMDVRPLTMRFERYDPSDYADVDLARR